MQRFRDEHPELAAMLQSLQAGIMDPEGGQHNGPYHNWDMWARGTELAEAASAAGYGYLATIAAGLRIVADAIDPPAMVEAMREIADKLGPSMLTPDEWEARLTAQNRERDKLNQLGPQGVPPQTRG